ncbi:MAG TPA: glycosyltransferase family 1 protein [Chloroflexota bacterium]|nr:glycosyltransferase family 1 protein [Chloroflexota bacterium]HUM69856.1 glycosyltransferase family 1 protein [Chloroflexota bacterium]
MLRAYDEKGGIGVYSRNIVPELLRLNRGHEFVLYYRNVAHLGLFAGCEGVTERLIHGSNKAFWDQVAIPRACRHDRIDVLFHPKFTAPLLAPCPVVMTVHGADWFVPEQAVFYGRLDVQYIRAVMPLYFKKCAAVISVSQLTTDNFNQALRLPPGKVQTIYFAPARHFRRVTDPATLQAVKSRYGLPERFILTLTKRLGDGRKNLGQIFNAYAQYHQQTADPCQLVIGGKDCHLFKAEYGIPNEGYGADILFPDWIDQQDLPAVYSLADLYLYPSNLEAFPIPLTEAMACGTPIITSSVNGLMEIAGDAAVFVDPADAAAIAEAMRRVLADSELQASLSAAGLTRATQFTWDTCAQETMALLEAVANRGGHDVA